MASYGINKEDCIGFNADWINFYNKKWHTSVDGNSYAIVHEKNSLNFNYNQSGLKNESIDFSTSFKILSNGYSIASKGYLFEPIEKKEHEIVPQPEENNRIFLIKTQHKDSVIKIYSNIEYPEGYHFYALHTKYEKHFNVFFDSNSKDLLLHIGKMAKKGGNYSPKTWSKDNNRKVILFGWEMIHVTRLSKYEWTIDNGIVYEEGI